MSTRKLIHNSLAISLTLTLASVASARRPPALVEAQDRTSAVFATCPQSRAQDTGGYRDMLARATRPAVPTRSIAATPPARKMGNHLVLVCEGGDIHQGSGYRDFPVRVRTESRPSQIAGGPRSTTVR